MAKTKEPYAGWDYIVEREAYLNSIGEFRCFDSEEDKPKCLKHCEKCKEYYVKK